MSQTIDNVITVDSSQIWLDIVATCRVVKDIVEFKILSNLRIARKSVFNMRNYATNI